MRLITATINIGDQFGRLTVTDIYKSRRSDHVRTLIDARCSGVDDEKLRPYCREYVVGMRAMLVTRGNGTRSCGCIGAAIRAARPQGRKFTAPYPIPPDIAKRAKGVRELCKLWSLGGDGSSTWLC